MDTSDVIGVYLKEYERLRAEIDSRTVLQHGILAAGVAAVGAVVSVVGNTPEALLGLALLLSYLWLLWLDHSLQVYRIGEYIATDLRPAVSGVAGTAALSWEWWFRQPEPGSEPEAERENVPRIPNKAAVRTGVAAGAVTIKLFQFGALASVGWYVYTLVHGGLSDRRWMLLLLATAVLVAHGYVWIWAYRRKWRIATNAAEQRVRGALENAEEPG